MWRGYAVGLHLLIGHSAALHWRIEEVPLAPHRVINRELVVAPLPAHARLGLDAHSLRLAAAGAVVTTAVGSVTAAAAHDTAAAASTAAAGTAAVATATVTVTVTGIADAAKPFEHREENRRRLLVRLLCSGSSGA